MLFSSVPTAHSQHNEHRRSTMRGLVLVIIAVLVAATALCILYREPTTHSRNSVTMTTAMRLQQLQHFALRARRAHHRESA